MTPDEERQGATLPQEAQGEASEMALVACADCGQLHDVASVRRGQDALGRGRPAVPTKLLGTLVCGICRSRTVFELEGPAIRFAPGDVLRVTVPRGVDASASASFEEAMTCFYGRAYRAVAAMCRSALEEELDAKHVPGRDLEKKIDAALANNLINQEHVALAHGSRVVGNHALHRMRVVLPGEALAALLNTATLLTHISGQPPMSATP
jgi:hypothetical protein